ncbi:hypothetical protein E4U41_006053 [Claviceps citrina]|nr:hypothetical protein E4U41_006053 [Claviceps citrina]
MDAAVGPLTGHGGAWPGQLLPNGEAIEPMIRRPSHRPSGSEKPIEKTIEKPGWKSGWKPGWKPGWIAASVHRIGPMAPHLVSDARSTAAAAVCQFQASKASLAHESRCTAVVPPNTEQRPLRGSKSSVVSTAGLVSSAPALLSRRAPTFGQLDADGTPGHDRWRAADAA